MITTYSEVVDIYSKKISSAENLVQCFAKCVPHTSKALRGLTKVVDEIIIFILGYEEKMCVKYLWYL
jgi:hypothetical protein